MKIHRSLRFILALSTLTAAVHAEDTPKPAHPNRTAGIVLTTIAASLLVSAPISALLGYAISTANRDGGVMGAFGIASFSSGCVGLGMIIPGIVLWTSGDDAQIAKQPTWTEMRPVGTNTPRVLTLPLLQASF